MKKKHLLYIFFKEQILHNKRQINENKKLCHQMTYVKHNMVGTKIILGYHRP